MHRTITALVALTLAACAFGAQRKPAPAKWTPIFDGKTLNGWTPKIKGLPLGQDPLRTFRVENGLLKVSYENYQRFAGEFGHLFYRKPLSRYAVRVEYRFVGDQCPGGPGWAFRNSGVMLHCQAPETMRVDQDFPVSIEAQLLGGDGTNPRTTSNVCTPGTNIVMGGKLITDHCTSSRSKTYHGDQWVVAEMEVHAGGRIVHKVNGETVLEYEQPQLDENDADGFALIKGGKKLLESGYISLQAESHPLEFRRVEIRTLPAR